MNQSCGTEATSPGIVPMNSGTSSVPNVVFALVAVSVWVTLANCLMVSSTAALFCLLPDG